MSKRTAAIDAAIAAVEGEMHQVETKRRELLYAAAGPDDDPLTGVGELTELSTKMVALHQRRAGLSDLRDAAVAQDKIDALKEKEAEIAEHLDAGAVALEKRADLGAKIDALIGQLGELLIEVESANDDASREFAEVFTLVPAERDSKMNMRIVVGDWLSGRAIGGALASKLREGGVGEVGIKADVIWNGTADSDGVAEAMQFAKQKVDIAMRSWVASFIESIEKPEPMPSRLTAEDRFRAKPYGQYTAEEGLAAAMASSGQRRPMTIDDIEDITDEEREGLRAHFDANGAGRAQVNGRSVVINKPQQGGRKQRTKS